MKTIDPATLKSERSAKILATKLDRKYDEAIGARNAVTAGARETGWGTEESETCRAHENVMASVLEEMDALKTAAALRGWYVTSKWLRYFGSAHRALVFANMD